MMLVMFLSESDGTFSITSNTGTMTRWSVLNSSSTTTSVTFLFLMSSYKTSAVYHWIYYPDPGLKVTGGLGGLSPPALSLAPQLHSCYERGDKGEGVKSEREPPQLFQTTLSIGYSLSRTFMAHYDWKTEVF